MIVWDLSDRPKLKSPSRMKYDQARQADMLLLPERVVTLNETAGAILWLCDGQRTIAQIIEELETKYETTNLEEDVVAFLVEAADKGWVEAWK
ncbi:MAG: pyrroloquinoline quinone biosynthesis peptide chaperone PqqD [Candidatus Cohnella colombiensis]|uniref:Pyrroloquinoline quinone biosynthesis peptide chaperone PqqD n=1 Tax=Candidatus Cohnella colombiensis TaxID=3121368 RepID=A0AA95JC03_9BACL|nr:MAG: pyrroloquinoline quinone biosynthesis peptide chaperone PqqD [Cohnella sp.]